MMKMWIFAHTQEVREQNSQAVNEALKSTAVREEEKLFGSCGEKTGNQ